MYFNSFSFIVIYPIIFMMYYLIPARWLRMRNLYLLMASYALYVSWNPMCCAALFGITIVAYFVALVLSNKEKRHKYIALAGAILLMLPLIIIKYSGFLLDAIADVSTQLGIRMELRGLNWVIPLGLSFYTLQALSYLSDVYHGKAEAEKDFVVFALWVSFFPTVTMGPITRFGDMMQQFKAMRPYFNYPKAVKGLRLLLWGMFMKVVVADRAGIYVDTIYNQFQLYSGMTCLVASLMYSIQIYSDFAGYSLMAIGIGGVMGFDIAENFNRPYFSQSVNEFWKRWHISLSSWLRDYIYIPLGGNKLGSVKTYRNLLITFLISGLWHGADWSFVVWGATHALWMILERLLNAVNKGKQKITRVARILLTFFVVNFAWIFFRLPTVHDAMEFICQMISLGSISNFTGPATITICMALLLFIKDFRDEYYPNGISVLSSKYSIIRWVGYICLISIILLEGVLDSGQFIYGNF